MLQRMSTRTTPSHQALRTVLEQRQTQLQRDLQAARAEDEQHTQDAEDLPPEPDANQSRDDSDREVRHAELLRDAQELQAVKAALQRMDEGSYGECVACGKDIAPQRLQVNPAAARCIACQSKAEARASA